MPGDVAAELHAAMTETACSQRYPLLMTVRRIREAVNSTGTTVPGLVPGGINPVSVHPGDLKALGLHDGQDVEVRSSSGRLRTRTRVDPTLTRGTVSITHCFGSLADNDEEYGANVNCLTGFNERVQTINAMPTLTALPVAIASTEHHERGTP
jgi:anaerobic selenocysteine-containing dehydrogenase